MTYLVGSGDTSAFTGTVTATANVWTWRQDVQSTMGRTPSQSGTANKLNLYLDAFVANNSLFAVYENDSLIASGNISSQSIDVSIAVDVTKKYSLRLLSNLSNLTWFSDPANPSYADVAAASSTPDATLTDGSWQGASLFYWSLESVSSDSITPVDPLTEGSTGNALNASGFASGAIDSVTVDGIAVTTNGTTFSSLDITSLASESGTAAPSIGSSVEVTASNGTESASANVTFSARANYTTTTIVTPDTVSAGSLYTLMAALANPLIVATGDQFYLDTTDLSSISDDGNYNFTALPKTFYYRNAVSGKWYDMTMTIAGIVVDGDAKRKKRRRTMIRNFTYYKEDWENINSDANDNNG